MRIKLSRQRKNAHGIGETISSATRVATCEGKSGDEQITDHESASLALWYRMFGRLGDVLSGAALVAVQAAMA